MFADKVVTQAMKKPKLVHVLLTYLLLLHRHKWIKFLKKTKQKNPQPFNSRKMHDKCCAQRHRGVTPDHCMTLTNIM